MEEVDESRIGNPDIVMAREASLFIEVEDFAASRFHPDAAKIDSTHHRIQLLSSSSELPVALYHHITANRSERSYLRTHLHVGDFYVSISNIAFHSTTSCPLESFAVIVVPSPRWFFRK
jgi:hypothetical protein